MKSLLYVLVAVYFLTCNKVSADYECVCNYNVEKSVLPSPDLASPPLGYMYEFDCKPSVTSDNVDASKWQPVAFEHGIGYVQIDPNIQVQICQGSPSSFDILTTTTPKPTTPTTTTTPVPTTPTTTPTPTTPTTTPRPTTHTTTSTPTTHTTTSTPSTPTTTPTTPTTTPTTPTTTPTTPTTTPTTPTTTPTTLTTTPRPTTTPTTPTTTPTTPTTTPTPTTPTTTPTPTTPTTTSTPTTPTTTHTPTTPTTTPTPTTPTTTPTPTTPDPSILPTTPKPTTSTTIRTSPTTKLSTPTTTPTTRTTRTTLPPTTTDPIRGNTYLCPGPVKTKSETDRTPLGQHKTSCYELLEVNKANWRDSESKCKQRGGHLVDITDADEQKFVTKFLQNFTPNHAVWIGLNDAKSEGVYSWSSGSGATFYNWYPGHSNHFLSHDVEDCVIIIPYKDGQWDDLPCLTYHNQPVVYSALCEYKIPQ